MPDPRVEDLERAAALHQAVAVVQEWHPPPRRWVPRPGPAFVMTAEIRATPWPARSTSGAASLTRTATTT